MNELDSTRLRELLQYDPETGIFIWIKKPPQSRKIGIEAGCNSCGYCYIHLKNKRYAAHRLAWLYIYGNFPQLSIDHINGNGLDNRISNLREATATQNSHNVYGPQSNNTSGYLGVHWVHHKRKWRSAIVVNNKKVSLGYFFTREAAYEAYLSAKRVLHPFTNL